MSKSEERASEREQDGPRSDSVFDFLYCDTRRIGYFLAQFDDAGHLERVIERESAAKKTKRGIEFTVGGGASVLGTGGQASLGVKRGPIDEGSESSERVYDPLWTNTRTLLDFLAENEMIVPEISHARIGQFVMVTGNLSIVDISIMKQILENPILKRGLSASVQVRIPTNRSERRKQGNQEGQSANIPSEIEQGMALVSIYPMTVQATLSYEDISVWCNLRDSALTIPSGDLLLQHGIDIIGSWSMLGILDAMPESVSNASIASIASKAFSGGLFSAALAQIAPAVRTVLGRPPTSYGITPLMIFRKVSG